MILAITRQVSPAIDRCELTHLAREPIDLNRARAQHRAYEHCLVELGCTVRSLHPEPHLPDSVFVEDTAIILDEVAIISRPGASSRRPETPSIERVLADYRVIRKIEPPGTLDGGDVLRIGATLFVGVSSRTDAEGINQLRAVVSPFGFTVTAVPIRECLHLKSAVTLVAPDTLLINRRWVDAGVFPPMRCVDVSPEEPGAANALLAGDRVVFPGAYPHTAQRLQSAGIRLSRVDVSELAKAEGGVTCCSLLVSLSGPRADT